MRPNALTGAGAGVSASADRDLNHDLIMPTHWSLSEHERDAESDDQSPSSSPSPPLSPSSPPPHSHAHQGGPSRVGPTASYSVPSAARPCARAVPRTSLRTRACTRWGGSTALSGHLRAPTTGRSSLRWRRRRASCALYDTCTSCARGALGALCLPHPSPPSSAPLLLLLRPSSTSSPPPLHLVSEP